MKNNRETKSQKWIIVLVILWTAAILFPMVTFSKNAGFSNLIDDIFGQEWIHIVSHSIIYAVLAIFLCMIFSRNNRRIWIVLGAILLVGVLHEFIQKWFRGYTPGAGELFDIGVDLFGGIAGILIYWLIDRKGQKS